ncbi:MAG: hypothetical protein KTR30_18005 [Saprospiraceae bacterium]|nr:hypothetical protein [Saprospiraceae bacterium]
MYSNLLATSYYLSSSEGDDHNPGTAVEPLKTLSQISSVALFPGDTVFFKRGDRFDGHFVVNGSGAESNPIVITSYGNGAKPILTGEAGAANGGDYREAVWVHNNDNIVFENLEVHNERLITRPGVDEAEAYGIHIMNDQGVTLSNFAFRNVEIRNVYALKTVDPANQSAFNAFNPAGIRIFSSWNWPGKVGNIDGVLIENCLFENLQRLGVHLKLPGANNNTGNDSLNRIANVIVRNNEFHHTGGTCVLPIRTYNCIIENNTFNYPGSTLDPRMPGRGSAVWTWKCINTVIQYNNSYHVRGILDSHGIHVDHDNVNTFVQYNYMEDSEGGFVEILGGNLNAVYRFNISVNDGWRSNPGWVNSNHTIWLNEKAAGGSIHQSDSSYIYNNTVYIDRDFSTAIDINATNTFIYNNIFHAINGASMGGQQVVVKNNGTPLYMTNNLFHGNVNTNFSDHDSSPVFGDPVFSDPGSGVAEGYLLDSISLVENAGIALRGPAIPGAGHGVFSDVTPWPEVDILGNLIEWREGQVNIGASNAKYDVVSSNNEPGFYPPAKFKLFPNPATDVLFFEGIRDQCLAEIVTISGQIIKQAVVKDTLDISDIEPGYYLVRIEGYIAKPFLKPEVRD